MDDHFGIGYLDGVAKDHLFGITGHFGVGYQNCGCRMALFEGF